MKTDVWVEKQCRIGELIRALNRLSRLTQKLREGAGSVPWEELKDRYAATEAECRDLASKLFDPCPDVT